MVFDVRLRFATPFVTGSNGHGDHVENPKHHWKLVFFLKKSVLP